MKFVKGDGYGPTTCVLRSTGTATRDQRRDLHRAVQNVIGKGYTTSTTGGDGGGGSANQGEGDVVNKCIVVNRKSHGDQRGGRGRGRGGSRGGKGKDRRDNNNNSERQRRSPPILCTALLTKIGIDQNDAVARLERVGLRNINIAGTKDKIGACVGL